MRSIGLTRATILLPAISYLTRIEAPIDRLLERSNLPPWRLMHPEALVPTVTAPRLLAEAAKALGLSDIGIRAAEAAPIETLGTFGRMIRGSSTLGEAVDMIIRLHPLYSSSGRMWLVERGDRVEFCQAFLDRFDAAWTPASHYFLMLMIQIVRLAAGSRWRPDEVRLQTGESLAFRDHPLFSGVAVRFAQPSTAVVFPRALLARPIRPAGVASATGELDSWVARAPVRDFAGALGQVVETLGRNEYPSIARVADVVGMKVRTVQRRLAAEGTGFGKLVDGLRFKRATELLTASDVNVLDVALEVGYSDHAHFTRAFRRWSGCSPSEFRRRHARPRDGRVAPPNARVLWEQRHGLLADPDAS